METASPPLAEPHTAAAPPVSPQSVFETIPWRLRDVVIGLGPFVVLRLIDLVHGAIEIPGAPNWSWIAASTLGLAWMAIYPLWAGRRLIGPFRLVRPWSVLREVLIALGLILPLLYAVGTATEWLKKWLGSGQDANPFGPIVYAPDRYHLIALTLLAVSLGPIAEELMFRGLVYNFLRRRLAVFIAAPITAILFALNHPFGLADMIGVGLSGLAFTLVYEWRKTLLASILLHAFENAIAMTMMNFAAAAYAASPVLGVTGDSTEGGVRITVVMPESAAAVAGVQVDDILVSVDSYSVTNRENMTQAVRLYQPGDTVILHILHQGAPLDLPALLKKRSP